MKQHEVQKATTKTIGCMYLQAPISPLWAADMTQHGAFQINHPSEVAGLFTAFLLSPEMFYFTAASWPQSHEMKPQFSGQNFSSCNLRLRHKETNKHLDFLAPCSSTK